MNPAGRIWLYWDEPQDDGDPDNPPGAPIVGYYIQAGPVDPGAASAAVTETTFVKPTTLEAGYTTRNRPTFADLEKVNGISPDRDVLYFVEAATDISLTTSVLNKLDDFAPGRPGTFDPDTNDPDADSPIVDLDDNVFPAGDEDAGDPDTSDDDEDNIITHWGIRVMAVNRVVQRHAEDGTIAAGNEDDTSGTDDDGNWTDIIRVNPAANDEPDDGVDPAEDGDVLGRPTLTTAKRDTNVDGGRTQIELEWKTSFKPDDAEVSYRLETSQDRIDWEPIDLDEDDTAPAVVGAVTEYDHTDLTAGTTYYYRVFATHLNTMVGQGGDAVGDNIFTEASLTKAVTTAQADKPDPPTLDSVEALSETEIEVMWTGPVSLARKQSDSARS